MLIIRKVMAIALAVFSIDAIGIEERHLYMTSISTEVKHKSVLPSRYHQFEREVRLLPNGSLQLHERWDIEVKTETNQKEVLYLPASIHESSDYESIYENLTVELLDSENKKTMLPINYAAFLYKNNYGVQKTAEIPFAEMPIGTGVLHLVVSFNKRIQSKAGLENYDAFFQLTLPEQVAVDGAKYILACSVECLSRVTYNSTGFLARPYNDHSVKPAIVFELENSWNTKKSEKAVDAPRLRLSMRTWEEIAEQHSNAYKSELDRSIEHDEPLVASVKSIANKQKEDDTRNKAFEAYRFVRQTLAYVTLEVHNNGRIEYSPKPLADILQSKTGNCTSFALFYIKVLQLLGIEAEPVEVNWDANFGALPIRDTIPRNFAFNHVIVYLPELDEYIDPTSMGNGKFEAARFIGASSEFANTYGLHLFSRELRLISPARTQNEILSDTAVTLNNGVWEGVSTLSGSGVGYATLARIDSGRTRRIADSKGYEFPFETMGLTEKKASWSFARNDLEGHGSIEYSFSVNTPVLSDDSTNIRLPRGIMSVLLFPFELMKTELNEERCFGSDKLIERIKINAFGLGTFPNIQDVHIEGVNSHFSQKVTYSHDNLTLVREFVRREPRSVCTEADVREQKAFYSSIIKSIESNHK